jgi:transcriptional antiterminator RfaH
MGILIVADETAMDAEGESTFVLEPGERWYAVHTLPVSELRAEANLLNQNFRTLLPKRLKTLRHARRLMTVEGPFFPRYLFIVLDPTRDQWRRVNGTFGVSRLVMRGDDPQPVPAGIVEAIQAACDKRGILQLGARLRIGQSVRMMAGPFAEQLAIIDQLDDNGRVRVLLEIMGRRVSISTHDQNVMPVHAA